MLLLENAIREKGKALDGDVLLVDAFLNNQVDMPLMAEIGKAFAEAVRDLGVTRIVTIESSGIAPAGMTAFAMGLPLVIMKKSMGRNMTGDILQTPVVSFTKNNTYQLTLKKKFIVPGDRVLLVDDFLASGEAAQGASRLIEEAGAQVAAIGIVIEKSFQPGRGILEGKGHRVISLARVEKMSPEGIAFAPADA